MKFPLVLGDEKVREAEYAQLPQDEQTFVLRLSHVMSARYWESFRVLRARRFKLVDAAAGAWLAAGYRGRGGMTHDQMAELLGISRRTFIRRLQDAELQRTALAQQMAWLNERVPSVDEALLAKAGGGDVSAMKLFYQRARVIMSEADTGAGQDNWMAALAAARAEAGEPVSRGEEVAP